MWVSINGWEELYEVNEVGEVRNKLNNRLLVGDKNSTGYMRVALYNKLHNPQKQRFFRHRLVAEHFIPNPYNFPEVNHKDSNIENNSVNNLEWVTRASNERHSHLHGDKIDRSYNVVYANGEKRFFSSCTELADEIRVTRRTVVNWLKRKSAGYLKHGIATINYRDSV